MSFSEEWEQRYRENTHLSLWPWSDLVSLVRRYRRDVNSRTRVLELGCGAGANIPFFQADNVQYHAVEGSASMVGLLRARFGEFGSRIVQGDFTISLPFEPGFDLIVDRASLTHNSTAAIEAALALVWRALKPGAYFIGVDWFSTRGSEFSRGQASLDPHTRTGYTQGPFAGTGRVHFSDEAHLRALFARFELLLLEEKLVRQVVPRDDQFASWNLVAKRPDA